MIEVPDEMWEEWDREYKEDLAKGLRTATDEEFHEIYEEVMKEIDEEIAEWDKEMLKEMEDGTFYEEDEWDKRYNAAATPEEKNRIWNERYGDRIYRALPEDIIPEHKIPSAEQ